MSEVNTLYSSNRLILADGTVLNNCECGYHSKNLWCFLHDIPFGEAFQYFSSPNKFKSITFEMTIGDIVDITKYSGFEEVTAVQQSENSVDVHLEGYKIGIEKIRKFLNDNSSDKDGE